MSKTTDIKDAIQAKLPSPTSPSFEPGPLPGDFYACEDLLSGEERKKVERIRKFARTEIAPIVNEHWARAEFPFQIIGRLFKEEMVAPDAFDRRSADFTTRRDAGDHCLCRVIAQQVGERKIGSGALLKKVQRLVNTTRHGKADILFCLYRVQD